MIPLGKIYVTGNEISEIEKLIQSGWWAGSGPTTKKLEEALHAYLKLPDDYKVCCVANCTVALQLCLEYLNVKDSLVAVPSYSFVASAFAVNHAGGIPLFVDINRHGQNISVEHLDELLSHHCSAGSVKGIVAVHQYGIPFDIEGVNALAQKYNLSVIEDAACAFGSKHRNNYIGSSGNLVCFSLHARKALTSGEGGFIVIPPGEDADFFFSMRNFGMDTTPFERHGVKTYQEVSYNKFGYNMKMSDIQAAFGLAQLQSYDQILSMRAAVAHKYKELLDNTPVKFFAIQFPDDELNWQNYRILVPQEDRDKLLMELRNRNIMAKTCIQPIHQQPVYTQTHRITLPNTEEVSKMGIWLPMFPELTDAQMQEIATVIKDYFNGKLSSS